MYAAAGLASPSQAAEVPPDLYVPGPVEVGPEIWAGVIASCIPFAIGSWEFAKRIVGIGLCSLFCWCMRLLLLEVTSVLQLLGIWLSPFIFAWAVQIIQQRCAVCKGSGLVMRGRYARKCPECGGFFPWQVRGAAAVQPGLFAKRGCPTTCPVQPRGGRISS